MIKAAKPKSTKVTSARMCCATQQAEVKNVHFAEVAKDKRMYKNTKPIQCHQKTIGITLHLQFAATACN